MTELLSKEFSRKAFLKGGGALVIGFSVAGTARAANSPFTIEPSFNMQAVDTFIVIHADNTASIKTGRVELGQGSTTGLLQIAAEELDMDLSQVRHVRHDTDVTPDTGQTAASSSITSAGPRVRMAAATARQALLGMAATQLGVPAAGLTVSKGVIAGGGRSVTYGQLIGGKLLNVAMASATVNPGVSPAKAVGQYSIVGTSPARIDIPDKVNAKYTYVQNIRVPGMLHGRVVRPRGQSVFGFVPKVVSIEPSSIRNIPGARVVRKGDFVGVVAASEYSAIQAAAQLKVEWSAPPATALPGNGNTFKAMRAQDSAGGSVQSYRVNTGNTDAGFASATQVISQTYGFPFNSLQAIGPDCAVAHVMATRAVVFCGSTNTYSSRAQLASLLGLPQKSVQVIYYESSSSFGGQQTANVDIPQAAALLSQLAGAPVRLQHMRWDEHGWGVYSPGHLADIRAGIDAKGNIVAYHSTAFYPQYKTSAGITEEQLGTTQPTSAGTSGASNPAPMYNIPNERFLLKSLPLPGNWFRVQWVRGGAAPLMNFASEQMIDELAHRAGMDPVAFRLQNLTQGPQRDAMLATLNAATGAAKWQPRVAASNRSSGNIATGRGVAMYFYGANSPTATVADIEVDKTTGKITVKHVYSASGAGLIINPALVQNQIEAAVVQMASRTLNEQIKFSRTNATSLDWVSYPIMRFNEAPKVTALIIQRPGEIPSLVGEPVSIPIPAAIANAFFDATGVRIRQAPLSPGSVRAALGAAKGGS